MNKPSQQHFPPPGRNPNVKIWLLKGRYHEADSCIKCTADSYLSIFIYLLSDHRQRVGKQRTATMKSSLLLHTSRTSEPALNKK